MATTLSGPMFEPSRSTYWQAVSCECGSSKEGGHYNIFGCVHEDEQGMAALRAMFPNGEANELNAVLFSMSGVHGTYSTIEEAEAAAQRGNKDEEGEDWTPSVTFLVVHPRIVCLRYGNCYPNTADDFAFLKRLRATSWNALTKIGAHP